MDEHVGSDVVRLNRLLGLIVESAVAALGFDSATATARRDAELSTMLATDQRMLALDDAQYGAGDGPCLSVLDGGDPVVWSEDRAEEAWAAFREAARAAGVLTSLSVHVPLDEPAEIAASLNFYAEQRLAVGGEQLRMAQLFAAQLAAALQSVEAQQAAARLASQVADAMRGRAIVEQARGILMAERQVGGAEAFRLLEAAQDGGTLVDAARRVVDERVRPDQRGE